MPLIRRVLRRLPILVVMVIAGAYGGHKLTALLTPKFTSSVSMLIDPKRPGALGADAQFANLYVDNTKINSVGSILTSSVLLQRVVDSEKLADDPEFGFYQPSLLQKALAYIHPAAQAPAPPESAEARAGRALDRLSRAVKVSRVGVTYVINIDVTALNPTTAQRLATAVTNAYLDDQVETKYAAVRRDGMWLSERLAELRKDLLSSERAVEAIRKKYELSEADTGTSSTGPNTTVATVGRQNVAELNRQLVTAQTEVALSQAKYEQVERIRRSGGSLDGLQEVMSSHIIQNLRGQQGDVDKRIADATARYTAKHPDLQNLQEERRAVDALIEGEIRRVVANLRNDYETALANLNNIKAQLASAVTDANSDTSTEGRSELREAQRIVDSNRGLYESYLNRLRELEQQQTRQDVEARIISPAMVPVTPSFPKPLLLLAGGAGGGGFLGLLLCLIPSRHERRFVNVADVEEKLALPVLGAAPMLRHRDAGAQPGVVDVVGYAARNPLTSFAESLRSLRIGLRLGEPDGPRIVQITSAVPGEGKSTLAAALAASAAMAGVRTVLLDADVRNSSVSAMFGLQGRSGVVDILHGNVSIQSSSTSHQKLPLTVIGSGSFDFPQPDMIGSNGFRNLIKSLGDDYDLLILDSPPVLAVSDGMMISSLADATLMVVEWKGTPKNVVDEAVKALRSVNAPLAGIMFNKADYGKMRKYGRTRHAYGSHYGTESKYYAPS